MPHVAWEDDRKRQKKTEKERKREKKKKKERRPEWKRREQDKKREREQGALHMKCVRLRYRPSGLSKRSGGHANRLQRTSSPSTKVRASSSYSASSSKNDKVKQQKKKNGTSSNKDTSVAPRDFDVSNIQKPRKGKNFFFFFFHSNSDSSRYFELASLKVEKLKLKLVFFLSSFSSLLFHLSLPPSLPLSLSLSLFRAENILKKLLRKTNRM